MVETRTGQFSELPNTSDVVPPDPQIFKSWHVDPHQSFNALDVVAPNIQESKLWEMNLLDLLIYLLVLVTVSLNGFYLPFFYFSALLVYTLFCPSAACVVYAFFLRS